LTDIRDSDAALLAKSGRAAEAAALAAVEKQELDPLQRIMGLPAPVWENVYDHKLTDGRCSVFSGSSRCPGIATHRAWIGCTVGEHLDKSDVCAAHEQMLGRDHASYHCRRCWDATGAISIARVIKTEAIDDDDGDTAAPPGPVPGLLP
jgi:hypothetical protein